VAVCPHFGDTSLAVKIAISIPDDVLRAAEATARRTGKPRSQIFAEAIRLYLRVHDENRITERLNEVYGSIASNLDPVLARMQSASMREDW
jgi:metal-responsive CopG/Arc/MetJ family transcriptional regulator